MIWFCDIKGIQASQDFGFDIFLSEDSLMARQCYGGRKGWGGGDDSDRWLFR